MFGRNASKFANIAWDLAFPLIIVPENLPLQKLNLSQRRNLKKAIKYCERSLGKTSKDRSNHWLLAKIHQRLGNRQEFLRCAFSAYRAYPEDISIITAATTAALELGEGKIAIDFSKLGLEICRNQDSIVVGNACLSYLISGNIELAIYYARAACRLDPKECSLIKVCEDVESGAKPVPERLDQVFY